MRGTRTARRVPAHAAALGLCQHRPMTMATGRRVGAVLARRELLLAAGQLAGIAAGLLLHALGHPGAGDGLWAVSAATTLVPLTVSVARSLLRRDLGVDVIALLAIAAALALGEYLAAAVVALMLAGGNALEAAAGRRARRELSALLARAPVSARVRRDGRIEEVPVDDVKPGDVVIVGAGEVFPVDGTVTSDGALVDESALTGEPLPVEHPRGSALRSGTVNAGGSVARGADRPASESAYAAVVRLVRAAEAQRAPFVRLADRYAAIFLPVTVGVAALAWGLSGDPVRGLAVLVVQPRAR
jgi:cation transport ATPase